MPRRRDRSTLARWARRIALVATGAIGTLVASVGVRFAIAPVERIDPYVFAASTIARGRALAAIGNCVGCHTAPGGAPNAGGFAVATPFGVVWGTNLTPDVETGIGSWSLVAFMRAMREGVSRDGHRLYPAFPYTAFTHLRDDDLAALYAYLMAQPAVRNVVPETKLAFPFGLRPLMAAWNGLFLSPGPLRIDETRGETWNRGRALVEGAGHCGACHTARNLLGAERDARALSGAIVDGRDAPALNAASRAPVAWTEQAFFDYLRHGWSDGHGAALGPMAEVVRELAHAGDDDVRAMAHYLASLQATGTTPRDPATVVAAARAAAPWPDARSRLFESACGACHHDDGGASGALGVDVPLALSTTLHADRPDNLLRTIVEGVRTPPARDVGFMPSFATAFDDAQLVELAGWLRRRFAPDAPPWNDLPAAVTRVREAVRSVPD